MSSAEATWVTSHRTLRLTLSLPRSIAWENNLEFSNVLHRSSLGSASTRDELVDLLGRLVSSCAHLTTLYNKSGGCALQAPIRVRAKAHSRSTREYHLLTMIVTFHLSPRPRRIKCTCSYDIRDEPEGLGSLTSRCDLDTVKINDWLVDRCEGVG